MSKSFRRVTDAYMCTGSHRTGDSSDGEEPLESELLLFLEGPNGGELETCTILTTEPNDLMAPIHDRMPVILPPTEAKRWIDTESKPDDLKPLFGPLPAEKMQAVPVSRMVNNPKHDNEKCLERIQ